MAQGRIRAPYPVDRQSRDGPGSLPPAIAAGIAVAIITVVQGNLTESRGETKRVHGPGSVIRVSEGTTHANENAGPETLVYVEVNITGTVPGPARAGTPPTK